MSAVSSIFVGFVQTKSANCDSCVMAWWMGTVPSVIFGGCVTLHWCVGVYELGAREIARALDMSKWSELAVKVIAGGSIWAFPWRKMCYLWLPSLYLT